MDERTVFGSDVVERRQERGPSEVCDLASPETLHGGDIQVFNEDRIVASAQLVCRLVVPVGSLMIQFAVYPVQLPAVGGLMFRAFLGLGQFPLPSADLVEQLMIEQRRFDMRSVGEGHVRLQAEVDACGCTRV